MEDAIHEGSEIDEEIISGEVKVKGTIVTRCEKQYYFQKLDNTLLSVTLLSLSCGEEKLWIEFPVSHVTTCLEGHRRHRVHPTLYAISLESFMDLGPDLAYTAEDKIKLIVFLEGIDAKLLGFIETSDQEQKDRELDQICSS